MKNRTYKIWSQTFFSAALVAASVGGIFTLTGRADDHSGEDEVSAAEVARNNAVFREVINLAALRSDLLALVAHTAHQLESASDESIHATILQKLLMEVSQRLDIAGLADSTSKDPKARACMLATDLYSDHCSNLKANSKESLDSYVMRLAEETSVDTIQDNIVMLIDDSREELESRIGKSQR